ncbi:cytochrome P450 2G1-like isoform X2 [Stegostoma tigrinum]|uniref:cytochrome P450 2G1-like isoform X2 n=1 Tax=Stegostoma tigrinum TaxID=3053191 RepID=UPI00286FE406|nr:cytochrome P450 2G1-like isoform X2 [Stegostoma tigrinum]
MDIYSYQLYILENMLTFCIVNVEKILKDFSNSNSCFHEDNLMYTTMHLFAAGMESISATLHGRMLLMMKYPEIQKKVHEEIIRVIGSEGPPKIEGRKDLPYTDAVIHEIQRFGDIVPHETTVDVNFRGYFIPKCRNLVEHDQLQTRASHYRCRNLETHKEKLEELSRSASMYGEEPFTPF